MKNLIKLTLLVNMVMAAQENDVNASNADIEEVVVNPIHKRGLEKRTVH